MNKTINSKVFLILLWSIISTLFGFSLYDLIITFDSIAHIEESLRADALAKNIEESTFLYLFTLPICGLLQTFILWYRFKNIKLSKLELWISLILLLPGIFKGTLIPIILTVFFWFKCNGEISE